jgi:antibiotic biosynthesis monooxygenase (ABM) superfamily enzyme
MLMTTTDPNPTGGTATAAGPAPTAARPALPSAHVRAVITWLAIFPLVAIGMLAMAQPTADWHPVLRALVLTLVVVPLAVYAVVPRLLGLYARLRSRR